MNNTSIFRSAFVVAWRHQWTETKKAARLTTGALLGFADHNSNNPALVYDHGMLWRILRDAGVVFATLIRVVVGLTVLLTMLVAVPTLLFLRTVLGVPLYALASAAWLKYQTWRWLDGGK